MEIDVFCIVPDEELFANVKANSLSCRKWAKSVPAHGGAAVLVGGGPSLRSRLESIRHRQQNGQKIFALNGACKFLNDNGILPDYQVMLDPQPLMIAYRGEAREHLVASQCPPSVFEALPDATLWHFAGEGTEANIPPHDEPFCLVGGGTSVGLTSLCLAYSMGYRKIHCYGYDSSYEDGESHAYPIPNHDITHIPTAGERIMVTTGGRKFMSTLALTKQAQNFPKLCDDLMDLGCTITVDCDGLLWAVVQQNIIAAQAA